MNETVLNQNIKNSTKWSLIGQIISKIASPLINMILARLLLPDEFAIVATITIIISFSFIFVDGGFSNYIVQHKFSSDDEYKQNLNTAFWSNSLLSLIFAVLVIALATPLCNFLGVPGYEVALMVASIQIPLNALSSIFIAHMNKNFKFKQSSIITVVTSFLPFIITVPLAIIGLSYYSLIIGTIASYFAKFLLYYIFSSWKPKFKFSILALKQMFSFSLILTIRQFFIYTASYMSTFIISQSFSQHYLGLYRNSSSTITSIYSIFTSATMSVLLSGLSKAENDTIFNKIFYNSQRYLSYLIIPMSIGIIIFKEQVTLIMFGDEWLEAAPIIGALAFFGACSAITNNFVSTAMIAKGKVVMSIIYQIVLTICDAAICYGFSTLGEDNYYYVSYVIGVFDIVVYFIFFLILTKNSFIKSLLNYLKPIILTAIMSLYTILASLVSLNIYSVISNIVISITIYFSFFYLMYKEDFYNLIQTYFYALKNKIDK